ncbi:MAG: hypothetical protein ABIF40_02695 [archaeon]
MAWEIVKTWAKGGSTKDAEHASWEYVCDTILPTFSEEFMQELIEASDTPYYPGFEFMLDICYPMVRKEIISRNIQQIVERDVKNLNCDACFWRIQDKSSILKDSMGEMDRTFNLEQVLLFGDSKEDFAMRPVLDASGLPFDIVSVNKKMNPKKFDERATIFIPRNYTGLLQVLG